MPEPKWMQDLDCGSYRAVKGAHLAAAWVRYLISRLPPKERSRAARAWKAGKTPAEVFSDVGGEGSTRGGSRPAGGRG